jgi:hypothetical protein
MPRFHINIWHGSNSMLDVRGKEFGSEDEARRYALAECVSLAKDGMTALDRAAWMVELTDAASKRLVVLPLPECE